MALPTTELLAEETVVKFTRSNSISLAEYYEQEESEHKRLYSFSNPYCLHYDRRRVDTVIQMANAIDTEGSFLDVGCASGYYVAKFSTGRSPYVGVDISHRKFKWVKENCTKNHEFVVCDATHLPFRSSSFGFILCSEVIEHLLEPLEGIKGNR